jgi:hypothetical protein
MKLQLQPMNHKHFGIRHVSVLGFKCEWLSLINEKMLDI